MRLCRLPGVAWLTDACAMHAVPIHVIAQFPRMQAMQVDEATIASALSHSSELVLHQSGTLVRRRTPLAAPAPAVADDWWRCCVVVEELPMDITNEGVRDMLAPFGQVQLVSLHAQQDSAVAGSASRQVMHGAAPLPRKALPRGRALLQPFATVTMGSVEQAGAAVSALEAQALAAGWRSQAPRCRLVVPQRQALAAKPVAKATVGAGGATSAAGERRPGGGHGDTTVPRPKAAQQQHEPLPRTRLAPPPMDGGRAGGGLVLMAKGPDGTRGFARPRSTPAA